MNRRFAFAPLTALGVHAEDGELRFSLQDASPKGFWKLAKSFDAKRALHLRVGGEAVQLRAGESFAMGHSGKFDRAGFHKMLQDGGFRLLADWLSADRRFVMAHVAPRL
ncbi:MAG TPA: L-histidine N(alpha)-methyltransferase [Vicinamibacteria bacterium]|nr:L-histidine N(alpha)-methyltransferase [Vicinamibacteria bacterium]